MWYTWYIHCICITYYKYIHYRSQHELTRSLHLSRAVPSRLSSSARSVSNSARMSCVFLKGNTSSVSCSRLDFHAWWSFHQGRLWMILPSYWHTIREKPYLSQLEGYCSIQVGCPKLSPTHLVFDISNLNSWWQSILSSPRKRYIRVYVSYHLYIQIYS
jgi:hypothetical protein